MKNTKIQWPHSTVNPVMGCDGCELWPGKAQVVAEIQNEIELASSLSGEPVSSVIRRAIGDRQMSEIYANRDSVANAIASVFNLSDDVRRRILDVVRQKAKCYAGLLGTMRGGHKGYADAFELPKMFPGRMAEAADWGPPTEKEIVDKPWLVGLARQVFISDMGDALSQNISFEYLDREIIRNVTSENGQRHIWLWLTKRPGRMAKFGRFLANRGTSWPKNLMGMTTITAQANASRISDLRNVPSKFRGLSIEPLFEAVDLDLNGIDWAIVGGGSDVLAEPFHVEWALDIHALCKKAGVAFFLKQLGKNPFFRGKPIKLDDRHGGDWREWPTQWRVREYPEGFRTLTNHLGHHECVEVATRP